MITDLTRVDFEQAVARPGIVLVDCRAAWCGSCEGFADVYRRVAARNPRHRFAQIDTDAQKELREALGITRIPSLLLYRDGVLLFRQAGQFDEETLQGIIAQAESLDMEKVRAELAAEAEALHGPEAA